MSSRLSFSNRAEISSSGAALSHAATSSSSSNNSDGNFEKISPPTTVLERTDSRAAPDGSPAANKGRNVAMKRPCLANARSIAGSPRRSRAASMSSSTSSLRHSASDCEARFFKSAASVSGDIAINSACLMMLL
ncbi:hypothetical protein D3C73_1118430 [compost metagenome]